MVYISGYKQGAPGADGTQNIVALLMAYNSSGAQQWAVEYGYEGWGVVVGALDSAYWIVLVWCIIIRGERRDNIFQENYLLLLSPGVSAIQETSRVGQITIYLSTVVDNLDPHVPVRDAVQDIYVYTTAVDHAGYASSHPAA